MEPIKFEDSYFTPIALCTFKGFRIAMLRSHKNGLTEHQPMFKNGIGDWKTFNRIGNSGPTQGQFTYSFNFMHFLKDRELLEEDDFPEVETLGEVRKLMSSSSV